MPNVDIGSVILASSILSISFGCILLAFSIPASRLRLHWAAAVVSYGMGGVLIVYREAFPLWLGHIVANMLVGVSVVMVHRGIWVMLGRRPPDRVYWGAMLALAIGFWFYTYVAVDLTARLFLISIFRVPFFGSAAFALYSHRRESGGAKVLLWLLACWSGWYAFRAVANLSSDQWGALLQSRPLLAVNFLVTVIGNLLITTAQFRMEAEAAVQKEAQQAAELRRHRAQLEQEVQARTGQLLAAKNEAERANRAKSHFLAAASHDLRQPLQALRLFMEILAMRCRNTPEAGVVEKAMAALGSSEALLNSLLDMSRLDAGAIQAVVQPVDLHGVVTHLAEEMGGVAAQKQVALHALPCRYTVMTDPVLLERALRNLLHNALRYTEQGRILIGCRRQGMRVRIEVWDTGIGIPEDKLDVIFDDFYQLGNRERDQSKGLGLGLAILRRLAVLLDWQLNVRSRLGCGSVFAIAVPMVGAD